MESYQSDPTARDLLTKLSISPDSAPPFTLTNGILRHKHRVWLGSSPTLQQKILHEFHASPVGGHSGALATYSRIKRLFFWPGLKYDVWSFVQSCAVCLQAKPECVCYPGFLQPLPVLSASWEVIIMDFIEGLPTSGSANAILVVVDKFSKFTHFISLRHPFTAAVVAKLFMDTVFRLHGLPKAIISD